MADIFISYRRSDSSDVTGRIFDHLKSKFGEPRLFKDVDSIPLGSDFRNVISDAVTECKVVLAIIGDDWLDVSDEDGRRRIDDPDDFVRIEVETALARQIPVIPVLVENAAMPKSMELPDSLKDLAFRNGTPVRSDPDFRHDMDRLHAQLEKYIELGPLRFQIPRRVMLWAMTATLIICGVIIAGVLWSRAGDNPDPSPDHETAALKREIEELREIVGKFDEFQRQVGSHSDTDEILIAWKQSQDEYTAAITRMTEVLGKVRPFHRDLPPAEQAVFENAQSFAISVEGRFEALARLLIDSWQKLGQWDVRAIPLEDVISGLEILERSAMLKEGILEFLDEESQLRIAQRAISDFQRMQGINPDGIMGRRTWKSLDALNQLSSKGT